VHPNALPFAHEKDVNDDVTVVIAVRLKTSSLANVNDVDNDDDATVVVVVRPSKKSLLGPRTRMLENCY
jgi:hypothetical protein